MRKGLPPTLCDYWLGNWVYVQKDHQETLEPNWKGPYVKLLTMPMVLKVDKMLTCIHQIHARPTGPFVMNKTIKDQAKTQKPTQTHVILILTLLAVLITVYSSSADMPAPEFNLETYR